MNKICFLFSFLLFLWAGYFCFTLQGIGFPDGHLTELDRALEIIYPIYIVVGFLFALYFLYLGINKNSTNAQFKSAILLLLLLICIAAAMEYFLQSKLENGTGG